MKRYWAFGLLTVAALPALYLFQNFSSTSSTSSSANGYDFTSHRGLYAMYRQPNGTTNPSRIDELNHAMTQPTIDGLSIQIGWDSLETAPNVFNWSEFDRLVTAAVINHKKIGLGIGGGAHAPDWLAQPPFNVPTLNLIWDKTSGRGTGNVDNDCYKKGYPLPWDSHYKSRYIKAVTAVRDHLHGMKFSGLPSNIAMNSVTYIKLAGLNVTSSEAMVPRNESSDVEICNATNDQQWVAAGYTKNKMVSAWQQIADGIAPLFINRVLVLEVISNGSFPRYDSKGNDLYPNGPQGPKTPMSSFDSITQALIDYGQKTYGARFQLQWDALSSQPNKCMDELVSLAKGGKLSWQLNERGGNRGSGYNTNLNEPQAFLPVCDSTSRTCHIPEYQYILDEGINAYRAELLELHILDVNIIGPTALATAQKQIRD